MRPRTTAVLRIVVTSLLLSTQTIAQMYPTITPRWMKSGHGSVESRCLALSFDGRIAVSGDAMFTKVWDTDTGHLLWTRPSPDSLRSQDLGRYGAYSAFFVPDENSLVTVSQENISIWDVSDGRLIRTFGGDDRDIRSAAIGSDGNTIVSVDDYDSLKVWDLTDGTLLFSFYLDSIDRYVRRLAISPDGEYVVLRDSKGYIRAWNITDGSFVRKLSGPDVETTNRQFPDVSLAFLPDTNLVIAGNGSDMVHIWSLPDGALVQTISGIPGKVQDVAVGPISDEIYVALINETPEPNRVTVWNYTEGTLLRTIPDSSNLSHGLLPGFRSLALSGDGSKIVTGGVMGEITAWQTNDGSLVREITQHSRGIEALAMSPDGASVVSGSNDNSIRKWNVSDGSRESLIPNTKGDSIGGPIHDVAYSPDGTSLAAVGGQGLVGIWDLIDTTFSRTFPVSGSGDIGHTDIVAAVAYAPDGKTLVTGGEDHTIKIWRVSDGHLVRTIAKTEDDTSPPLGLINSLLVTNDGTKIISTGEDNFVRIWSLNDGTLLRSLPAPGRYYTWYPTCVAVTPDDSLLVSGGTDSYIKVWRMSDGELLRKIDVNHVAYGVATIHALVISPDGRAIVSACFDGTIKIWDISNGNLTHTLYGHPFTAYCVAISPDGSTIVSGGRDANLIAWTVDPPFADWTVLPVDADETVRPASATLHLSAPNPFNATTTIRFSLSQPMHAQLDVYNVAGQRVTTLVNTLLPVGFHEVKWNASNSHNRPVGSGVYIYRLTTPAGVAVSKTTLLR
jgi:WD40 repeat protein